LSGSCWMTRMLMSANHFRNSKRVQIRDTIATYQRAF
jgi:hypothetical protein